MILCVFGAAESHLCQPPFPRPLPSLSVQVESRHYAGPTPENQAWLLCRSLQSTLGMLTSATSLRLQTLDGGMLERITTPEEDAILDQAALLGNTVKFEQARAALAKYGEGSAL